MAASPSDNANGVVKYVIKLNGNDQSNALRVHSIRVVKQVNRIAKAWIHLVDGEIGSGEFPASDMDDLSPGAKIEIEAGYGDDTAVIFTGILVRHGLDIGTSGHSRVSLECVDQAIKMTFQRQHANFVALADGSSVRDSDAMQTIFNKYADITPSVTSTTPELKSLVQYGATDWDFILTRAEINGMVVINDDAALTIAKPDFSSTPVLSVTYGADLMEFRAAIDARFQPSSVTSVGWSTSELDVVSQSANAEPDSSTRGQKNGDLASVLGYETFTLKTSTAQEQALLTAWSEAQLVKSQLAQLRGHMKFQGSADAKIGALIEVKGVGERFSGNVYCSSVEQRLEEGNWQTHVEFGCDHMWFAESSGLTAPDAAGLVPGFNGLQIGIVQKLDEDPDGIYRVQVKIPLQQAETEGIWARLGHLYASSGCGSFFIPEKGDEVIIGYLNSDPSYPVVIGSLYSAKNKSPLEHTDENYTKAIITNSQLTLSFDDENKIINLITPGGHKVALDDTDKKILIQTSGGQSVTLSDDSNEIALADSNGNSITLNSSGISLSSSSDITLSASANVDISAGAKATLSGDAGLVASGTASAEISSSGTMTVKGTMVMIN